MKEKVQVLLSTLNIKSKDEFERLLKKNHIVTDVIAINQVDDNSKILNLKINRKILKSNQEKGASKSRNRLLENAKGDICIFADDDMIYNKNYKEIILKEFHKNKNADIIIFNIKNQNPNREKIKKIRNKKINKFDIMRVRTSEIAFRREIIQKKNIKFDLKFGPNSIFSKGEETIFLADCLKNKINIISRNINIGYVYSDESTWFEGYNEKYLFDQGAVFYRIYPKLYKLLIIQYIIRKYKLYKENISWINALKQMRQGAKKCKQLYGGKNGISDDKCYYNNI